jgi:hypothetical protein
MASPLLLQDDWSAGMRSDRSRDAMPPGSSWNLVDYVPEVLGTPLRKRGGWKYFSNDISAVEAGAVFTYAAIYADNLSTAVTEKVFAIDDDTTFYKIAAAGTVTKIGASGAIGGAPSSKIFTYRGRIIIPIGPSGVVKSYDGSTLGNLAASAPTAFYGCVYKDRFVLARGGTTNDQRMWFSAAGDPTSWDTSTGYIDFSGPLRGIAALSNAIIAFTPSRTERLRGSIPPPGSDMVREPLADIGCIDGRSVVVFGDSVIWADTRGVFMTDGAAITDLTELGEIKSHWREQLPLATAVSAGVLRGHYIVSLRTDAGVIDTLACHITTRSWFRISNLPAILFASAEGHTEELYCAYLGGPRVLSLSSMFDPAAAVKNDGNGTAVLPVLETPFYTLGRPGTKSLKKVYAGYMLEDAASDNPALQIGYAKTPHATSYTNLARNLDESDLFTRARRDLGFSSLGVALKISQTAASADTHLHTLEADVHAREPSRL